MSKVRKDRAAFKVNGMYFFMKKDDWGSIWQFNKFDAFRIVDDIVCRHVSYQRDMWEPMNKEVQDAYQNWLVESILLGDK